jgi:hypothetical protein
MLGKNESMFLIIGSYVKQILEIFGSQIEIEKIFSLTEFFTSFRRCHFQLGNLDKLNFVNENWPDGLRIGCKDPFNLLEWIGIVADLDLEEFEEFEKAFERDEVMEFLILN